MHRRDSNHDNDKHNDKHNGIEKLILPRIRDRDAVLTLPCDDKNEDRISDSIITEIVTSLYSYTYQQCTGKLLSIRLSAMQRSLSSLTSKDFSGSLCSSNPAELSSLKITHLINDLAASSNDSRFFLPIDRHYRETNEEMLEFLAVPYIDLAPIDSTFVESPSQPSSASSNQMSSTSIRRSSLTSPPSLFRRAGSMIFSPQDVTIGSSNPEFTRGIATPLQHLSSKKVSRQALFTTLAEPPFKIKNMNDIASLIVGMSLQTAQSLYFQDFVAPKFHDWLKSELNSAKESRVKLCGELIELGGILVSIWVEAPGTGLLIWIIEEVLLFEKNFTNEQIDKPPKNSDLANNKIHRIPAGSNKVVLQGENKLWIPMTIGCAVLVNRQDLSIVGYNRGTLSLLLGTDRNLKGSKFTDLVPQFEGFWHDISERITFPGIVIPEHHIRRLAGIPLTSTLYIAPNPSEDAEKSIKLVTEFGVLYIDLQVRLIQNDLLMIWLSYSRHCPSKGDIIPQIASVITATPPLSPKITPNSTQSSAKHNSPVTGTEAEYWLDIEVGKNRRITKFVDFQPIKFLGRGAYGEVRLAKTPSENRVVVLKSIYKDRILVDTWSRDKVLGTIPNEIRVLNQLRSTKHPNIVTMIDFFEDEQYYHVEMLPCGSFQAMDLFEFIEIKGEDCSPSYLLWLWKQVVSAVAHIHSLGIVHRDLKDENVIIDGQDCAKLIDFGSTAYTSQGPFDVFMGTLDYCAPEVVSGELYDGPPQDMWALGILLFTMLFRETPFKNADEIVMASYPRNVESCLGDSIIRGLLSKLPTDRPTAKKLITDLM